MAMNNNECAMGRFPLAGDASTDPERFTDQFAPRGEIREVNGIKSALCHGCDQYTMVKSEKPRRGYFVYHKSSIQGSAVGHDKSQTHGRKGTPPRKRGREIYVKRD